MKAARLIILVALSFNALVQTLFILWALFLLVLSRLGAAIFPDAKADVDTALPLHSAFLLISLAGILVLDLARTREGRDWQRRSRRVKLKMAGVTVLLIGATTPFWPQMSDALRTAQYHQARMATSLVDAVKAGDVEVVERRIRGGADLEVVDDNYGWTPLFLAAFNGHPEMIATLIEGGADVDARMDDGFTALMQGAANPDYGFEIVRLLIEARADVHLRHNDGRTALIFGAQANARRSPDAMRILLEAGADINAQSNRGTSALMWASGWGHSRTVLVLLEAGANVHLEDEDGDTALARALEQEEHEIADFLQAAGATH